MIFCANYEAFVLNQNDTHFWYAPWINETYNLEMGIQYPMWIGERPPSHDLTAIIAHGKPRLLYFFAKHYCPLFILFLLFEWIEYIETVFLFR